MDDESGSGPQGIRKAFTPGLAKTLLLFGWVCLFALAPACVEAGDAASGPPAAITPDGGRYWGPLVGGVRQGEGRVSGATAARTRVASSTESFPARVACGPPRARSSRAISRGTGLRRRHHDPDWRRGLRRRGPQGQVRRPRSPQGPQHRLRRAVPEQPLSRARRRQKGGRSYKGEFVRGVFQGKCRYAIAEAPTYEGDFVEGNLHGRGIVDYPNGA